ncbi:MAG TPA: hypothetical protein VG711_10035 [Phycisphaerales bacterium]|nr:hypothetical protein [Phycisphaerales bacterium]
MTHEPVDILISRIVGGEASETEWSQFTAQATAQPSLWQRLAMTQRDHGLIAAATEQIVSAADHVELPMEAFEVSAAERDSSRHYRIETHLRSKQWAGWAVAALVAVAFFVRSSIHNYNQSGTAVNTAGLGSNVLDLSKASPDSVLQAYLNKGQQSGQVVGMVPTKLLMDTKPVEGGQGYEVLFVRQIIERTRIHDLYQLQGMDENQQPVFVPYTHVVATRR